MGVPKSKHFSLAAASEAIQTQFVVAAQSQMAAFAHIRGLCNPQASA